MGSEMCIRDRGEWIGYRDAATSSIPFPNNASEREKYAQLTASSTTPTTILYFHGGAFFLMDPWTHRKPCARLARVTAGRCFSVRYRLAPQHPFPAALLDAIVAYLNLLYPKEGAMHERVEARHIVFSGDSAGGCLSLVLLLFILWLRRERGGILIWNGRKVQVPLPAGVASMAPW